MKIYKKPESVLVVIYVALTKQVLMLQRQDDPLFWQSVTGSLEENETPYMTAIREVKEETGIDIIADHLTLVDAHYSLIFDIFPQFLHRYQPGVTQNKEHWFYLALPHEYPILMTEHDSYQWLPYQQAAALTKSANNGQAILKLAE
ncbi:dihydroneopterin triphosphate diphosphatase [Utexia brackfieldae]|uniref:dihydroneopterin triphosphate diphosphatase n=1 Tax=Utexia brackfieldae TaxID=3074108 RepID=UPI00370DB5D3